MNGSAKAIRIICYCLMALMAIPVRAQINEAWIDVAEEILDRQGDAGLSEEQCEDQENLLLYPINLNLATSQQLEMCGLFSSYQVNTIIEYRENYGALLTVFELASLPGFRKQRLEEQERFMTVHNTARGEAGKIAGSRLLLYAGNKSISIENQTSYPGSPWRTSLRFKTGLGRNMSAGLAYEKDAGEKGRNGLRPEHLAGYMEMRGNRTLEQLIIGTYRISNGMGLIQGAGLMHSPEVIQSRPLLLSSLKPYAGASEAIIHQGASCRLNFGHLRIVLWTSLQNADLSLSKLSSITGEIDWTDYLRESGLHRTSTEQSGRNLAYLGSAGLQLSAVIGKLNLGVQYAPGISGLTRRGRDSLDYHHGPALYHSTSAQWQWRLPKLELYGEFAPGGKSSSALLAGSRFYINDFLSGLVQIHWYGSAHRETFASAYASGSHILNEKGLLLVIHAEPFSGIQADVAIELSEYPAPRTHALVPSSGFRCQLTIGNGSRAKLLWRMRIVSTSKQQTPSTDRPGIRPLARVNNNKIDGRLIYTPSARFTWQSRLVLSYMPGKLRGGGHAGLQQLNFRVSSWLKCTAQLLVFNIPSWNNRIYLYEPGLFQQFSFPVYSGTGNKISGVVAVKPFRGITLEGKGSFYRDTEKEKWEAGLQLRLNF